MLTQLQTPIPLKTPKGKAWAVAIIDYGPQWDLQWVTFIHATGECWTFRNRDIRQEENFTFALPQPSPINAPVYNESKNDNAPQLNGSASYNLMRPSEENLTKQ